MTLLWSPRIELQLPLAFEFRIAGKLYLKTLEAPTLFDPETEDVMGEWDEASGVISAPHQWGDSDDDDDDDRGQGGP